MKRTIVTSVFILLLCNLFAQHQFQYKVQGTLSSDVHNGKEIFLYRCGVGTSINKALINGNKFEFTGVADSATFCNINIERDYCPLILESGVISADLKTHKPSGTPLNEKYAQWVSCLDSLLSYRELKAKSINDSVADPDLRNHMLAQFRDQWKELYKKAQVKFLKDNPNNEFGTALAIDYLSHATPEEFDAIYPSLGKWVLSRPLVKEVIKAVDARRNMAVGKHFLDFEAENLTGGKVKMSDYLGKGKYVLVVYWASWCQPCIAEVPFLKEVYKEYRGKDFEIVSVAVWDKPENSKKRIDELQMEWPQIINAGNQPIKLYGFPGVPQLMLFAPDGTIVSSDLREQGIKDKIDGVMRNL